MPFFLTKQGLKTPLVRVLELILELVALFGSESISVSFVSHRHLHRSGDSAARVVSRFGLAVRRYETGRQKYLGSIPFRLSGLSLQKGCGLWRLSLSSHN